MEFNNLRSPSVLSDLNVNIQDDLMKKTSPTSSSNSLKNSSNSSENAKEVDSIYDQENKPPGSVESTSSSTDGFTFKKPLPRETMPNEENVLNSLIDGLSHLKLGAAPVHERRFNSCKWTTPLKRKATQSDDSCSSSECWSVDKNSHHSAPSNEVRAVNSPINLTFEKSDGETVNSRNDDDCSEYYDCSDDENATSEGACVSEMISDHCNTADSSFHSVPEKEHAAESADGNSKFVVTDSEPVNEASLAEINRTQGNDQAFILEKYLTDQDFKLELSLSDVSFNAVTGGIDFELGKRESICTQTENPVSSSLFTFGQQEKSALCFTEYPDVNNVTIQADQFDNMASFTKENEMQTEESLFNLISDYLVQNETRSSFVTESEENIFTLGGISEAGSLRIDTVALEDALMQPSVRKSLLLECSYSNVNQNDVNKSLTRDSQTQTTTESQVQQISEKVGAELDTVNDNNASHEETSSDEISTLALVSCSQITDTDQFEFDDANKSVEISITSSAKLNETVDLESTQTYEENSIESNQSTSNETVTLESITTIDEILTEINKNSKNLNETIEFSRKTCYSPSSLNATIDTESIEDDSFSEKSACVADSETNQNITESDFELSQKFYLKMEQTPSRKNVNETINSREMQTGDYLAEHRPHELKSNQSVVLEKTTPEVMEQTEEENLEVAVNETADLEAIEVMDENPKQTFEDELKESVDLNRFSLTDFRSPRERRFRPIHNVDFFMKESRHEEHKESLKIAKEINVTLSETKSNEMKSSLEIDDVSDEKMNEEGSDHKQLCENTNLDTFSANIENLAEQCEKLALNETANSDKPAVTDENAKGKAADALNEYVDLNSISIIRTPRGRRFRPIHNVDFFIKADPHEEKSDESSFKITKVTDETSETKSNEKLDSEIAEISDRESNKKSPDTSLDVIPTTIENLSEQCPELAISETANSEITEVADENVPSAVEDDFNKSANIKSLLTIEDDIALRKMRCTPMRSVRYFDQIIEDEIEKKGDKPSSAESIQMANQGIVGMSSESPEFSQSDDVKVAQAIEKGIEDIAESDNFDMTVNLETDETSRVEHSVSIQTPSHGMDEKVENISDNLNQTVDLEGTRIIEDKPAEFVDFDERVNLETTKTIENGSSAVNQGPSRLNETFDTNPAKLLEENCGNFVSFDIENGTLNFEKPTSPPVNDFLELDEHVIMKIVRFTYKNDISHSSKSVSIKKNVDAFAETGEIEPCSDQNVTGINFSSIKTEVAVMPTQSSENIPKRSPNRFEIVDNLPTFLTTPVSNLNDDISSDDSQTESMNEPNAGSGNAIDEQTPEQSDTLDISNTRSCDATVIVHGSPSPRRSNSPARFDIHAVPMHDIASPIPPNSPTELSNKWRTHVDLSSVADHLEYFSGRNSPSDSSDEMDVTDPIDSNIAPEMLQMMKLPPGINRSYSNLESIPEINENELNEEQSASEANVNQDTKDRSSCEAESTANQTAILTSSETQTTANVLNSTQIITSPLSAPKPEIGLDESAITAAPVNPNDLIFKTPISKLPPQSDLSAVHDSSFNADYCFARSASTKSIQSSRQSLVSPKHSFYDKSPSIYSPFCTPNRRLRHASPKVSGDVPASLLDMSIGCFEKYTANQTGSTKSSGDEINKTIDVDDEPKHEETKLLYIEEPNKKVNVKTQTHDTELLDLRAENAKLKEDIEGLMELTEAMAHRETELRSTMQRLVHNETELKKAVDQHLDNNRLLNNRYENLKQCSNDLLAKRNAELDEAEEKIRILEAKLEKYTKKSEASSN